MKQMLLKLALPLKAWKSNFLLNVVIAWQHVAGVGPFDAQLSDKLREFYDKQVWPYLGMDEAELIKRVMEAGLTWYLVFVPDLQFYTLPNLKYDMQYMRRESTHPFIPLPSLKQFIHKLVLNMLCCMYTRLSTRDALFTRESQDYLSELWINWNTSDEFSVPYYHVCVDTIRRGQAILMMSSPPENEVDRLWTRHPDLIYYHLGVQYDPVIGEYMHESVHKPKRVEFKAFLLKNYPTRTLLDPSLEQLEWISASKIREISDGKDLRAEH